MLSIAITVGIGFVAGKVITMNLIKLLISHLESTLGGKSRA